MKKLEWRKMLQLAFAQQQQGKFAAAIADYQEILTFRPEEAQVYYYLGSALLQDEQLEEAINTYEKALSLAPDSFPDIYYNLGLLYHKLGQIDRAIGAYEKFIAFKPNFAPAYSNFGKALQEQGKIDEAIKAYQRAISLKPDYFAYHNLGDALQEQDQIDEAIQAYETALSLNPDCAATCTNLGNSLQKQGKIEEAIACHKKAISLAPNLAIAYNNLGNALQELGNFEDAIVACKQAVTLDDNYEVAYNNMGNALQELGRVEEAIASYQKAIDINSNSDAHNGLGMSLLQKGEFTLGFQEYEWRFEHKEFPRNIGNLPIWDGKSSLKNKTILIRSEQGFGDMLQFSRYVPLVAEKGAKVILESPSALVSLLETVPEVEKVVVSGTVVTEADCQVWLMSLPHLCGTTLDTIPATIPYLFPPVTNLPELLENKQLNVGLVWSSGLTNPTSKKRSCPLELFARILKKEDINWYSLQKEPTAADLDLLETLPVVDLRENLVDFQATAAIISQLDLVISVDTSVAHLVGAIGKPVWVLLPAVAEWRWLLDREDSPWYPTMRLFRQSQPGDWSMVLTRVNKELDNLL